ncbi:MAG: energy transducer TonB [Candidatus Eremiobacteraeota bacterium]|nr:energy transducer TonB [Candidatus Eremiobacteraeota bacterium]
MKRTSNLRVLKIAIAASVAVHLLFVPFIRMKPVSANEQQPKAITVVTVRIPKPKPTLKPTPPPKRQPPRKMHRPVVAIHTVVLPRRSAEHSTTARNDRARPPAGPLTAGDDSGNPGVDIAGTNAPTTLPASPTASPKPSCTAPDVEAKTLVPVAPDEPQAASDQGLTGSVQIEVLLGTSGLVRDASVYRSSGSPLLDQAALRAARASTYAPEQRDCHAIPGAYLFTAEFSQ